jgi:hypothetical protein
MGIFYAAILTENANPVMAAIRRFAVFERRVGEVTV